MLTLQILEAQPWTVDPELFIINSLKLRIRNRSRVHLRLPFSVARACRGVLRMDVGSALKPPVCLTINLHVRFGGP